MKRRKTGEAKWGIQRRCRQSKATDTGDHPRGEGEETKFLEACLQAEVERGGPWRRTQRGEGERR